LNKFKNIKYKKIYYFDRVSNVTSVSYFPDQYTVSIKYIKLEEKNFDCAKYNALSIHNSHNLFYSSQLN